MIPSLFCGLILNTLRTFAPAVTRLTSAASIKLHSIECSMEEAARGMRRSGVNGVGVEEDEEAADVEPNVLLREEFIWKRSFLHPIKI